MSPADTDSAAPAYSPEWARETLKALGHKPRRPLTDYLSGEELITAKLALKVLSVDANPALKSRSPRFAVHTAGGRVRIKVFLTPRVTLPAGLRRI